MGCPFRTPRGGAEAIRAIFDGLWGDTPPGTLVGPEGVGAPYFGCCDSGILIVEWLSTAPAAPTESSVSGRKCFDDIWADFRVTYKSCVQTFESGVQGKPVPIAVRNAAAVAFADRAWQMIETLMCAINGEALEDCDVKFLNHRFSPPLGACWTLTLNLRAAVMVCC